ncbi:MAG: VWA domain-containing protein [Gemmataceae bacterium]
MSRFFILGALLALATGASLPVSSAPVPPVKRPRVEIVFVTDTTGSMSLIEPAKNKIHQIINLVLGSKPTPELRFGLVAFKDRGDEYVTRPFDLREDFDEVHVEFKTYTANGGGDTPESVNQALDDAVNKLSWSKDRKAIKLVFLIGDAAAHMDYPDDVKFPVTCRRAKDLGIVINTIQAGNDAACTKEFKEIAEMTGGEYGTINSTGGMRTINAEQDVRLAEINRTLLRTAIPFGDAVKRERDLKKFEAMAALPADAAADRAGIMGKLRRLSGGDLLDAVRTGQARLAALKNEELTPELAKMTPKEREDHLDKVSQERAKLFQQALELDRQRSPFVLKEVEKGKDGLDFQVFDMIRKQTQKRLRY